MSRRRKSHRPRNAKRTPQRSAIYVVSAAVGIVDAVAEVCAERRELAQAKRTVERALRAAGMPRKLAERTIAAMLPSAILTEAERVRAAEGSP